MAAAGSTVSRPITRSLGGCGSCLVPKKTGLPPGPWSVGLALGQGSTSLSTVGSTDRACYQVSRKVWSLPCPWDSSCCITGQIPVWIGLAPDHRKVWLKPSHRALQGLQSESRSADLPLGIQEYISCWVSGKVGPISGRTNLRPWPRGSGARLWATSSCTAKTGHLACYPRHTGVWIFPGPLADGLGRTKDKQGCHQVHRGIGLFL